MRRLLLASFALAAAAPEARAQVEAEVFGVPGPLLSATVTQSFVADSNLDLDEDDPGESYYGDTRVILGLLNATPIQTFALSLDTGLRALWQAEEDFDFTFASPSTARVDYDRAWASGGIETFARFRQRDVDQSLLIDDDLDSDSPDDLRQIQQDGTEQRYDAGVGLEFATDSPSSYALNFAGTRFDYSGDAGDRTPRTTLEGDAAWILELNPVISGTFGGAYSYYDAENPQETQIRQGEVEAGVIYDPSEILRLTFGIGYASYIREQLVGGRRETLDDDQGFLLNGGLRYLFEEITVEANARLTNAAPETRLSGDVRARYPLANGALFGRVFQNYGGGDTGEEIRVTGATIGLEHEINTVSRLAFDASVARQQNLDTDESDIDRLNFTATYSYDLTEVVSANLGYRYRSRDESPESATSNAVFVEIGRTFETRP